MAKQDTAFCEDCRQFKHVGGRILGKPYCSDCLKPDRMVPDCGGGRRLGRSVGEGGNSNASGDRVRALEDR